MHGITARGRIGARTAAAILIGTLLGACSSGGLLGSSAPAPSAATSGSFRDRMSNMLSGGAPGAAPEAAPGTTAIDCPPIDIRQGTSTLASHAGTDTSPNNLRYQVSIGQTARECAALGATLTIKVGVQGRIVMGPAGAPGQIDIPMRFALVREGAEPKTLWTKLYKVAVTVQPGQGNVPFLQIEEDLTVPMPKAADLDASVIYVGFDPEGAKEQPKRPAKKRKTS